MKKEKPQKRKKLSQILSKYNFPKEENPREEKIRIEENEDIIDEKLDELEEYVGRKLTDKEEDDILAIVDELTPVGKNGKYIVGLLPFDYAWTIYEARKDQELEHFLGDLEVDS